MIVFASRTGNVRYIIEKVQALSEHVIPTIDLMNQLAVSEPFLLITYTDGHGTVPLTVKTFMKHNHAYCRGVIASGNTNFGVTNFGRAADLIAKQYHIPVLAKIDLRGKTKDYIHILTMYKEKIKDADDRK